MTSTLRELPRKPKAPVEPQGGTMTTKDGRTWQGFAPVDDDDARYFERATAPDGTETWYILARFNGFDAEGLVLTAQVNFNAEEAGE